MKKIVIVSGYFNPLHKGHIEYFELSKANADLLYVIVNNDFQRQLKGSKKFMLEDERVLIISKLKIVDKVYLSIDKDRDVSKTLKLIHKEESDAKLIFANGGDQTNKSIPEREICNELGIHLIDNLGEKVQSSSWLLNRDK